MTKNIKLLLSGGALVAFAAISLQGCSSSDDSSSSTAGTGGASAGSAGKSSTGGTSSSTGGKGGTSSTGGTSAAGTGTTTEGGAAAEAGSPGVGTAGASDGAAGAPAEVTQADLCTSFCADEAGGLCTGDLNAYPNNDCMTACNQFALGMPDDVGGSTGQHDNLYCRIYHLSVANSSAANAKVHCLHTGAASVNNDAGHTPGPCSNF
jgi:hypothetical protein